MNIKDTIDFFLLPFLFFIHLEIEIQAYVFIVILSYQAFFDSLFKKKNKRLRAIKLVTFFVFFKNYLLGEIKIIIALFQHVL